MSARGSKVNTVQRIETLKGWARQVGKQFGKDIPLVPTPVVAKPKRSFKKR